MSVLHSIVCLQVHRLYHASFFFPGRTDRLIELVNIWTLSGDRRERWGRGKGAHGFKIHLLCLFKEIFDDLVRVSVPTTVEIGFWGGGGGSGKGASTLKITNT